MKRVLVAVDNIQDSKGMVSALYKLSRIPEEVILLHVQRLEGKSLMTDMLGSAEIATLKEQLVGTDHKKELDREAEKILTWYSKEFHDSRFHVKTVVRAGVPSEEILQVAKEESADLILLGRSGKKGIDRFITGSVADDLKKHADIPVWVGKPPRAMNEKVGSLLFLLGLLVFGIYYASVTLVEIGEGFSAGTEMKPFSVYFFMAVVVMVIGSIVTLIGGLIGRIIISGNHITIEKQSPSQSQRI
jgi:nucleotide-binding universal stress UspA family protein